VIVSITFLLCLAINFRAFSEMRQQTSENTLLNEQIKKLTTENSVLQEEAKNLKNDPQTIAREARKIGMSRPNEKVLVPIP
jgi:cell division protein FtsB